MKACGEEGILFQDIDRGLAWHWVNLTKFSVTAVDTALFSE